MSKHIKPPRSLFMKIAASEAALAEVPLAALFGPDRWREVAYARAMTAKRLSYFGVYSLPGIASHFGKHHTTILHYLREEYPLVCERPSGTLIIDRRCSAKARARERAARPAQPTPRPVAPIAEPAFIRPASKAQMMRGRA